MFPVNCAGTIIGRITDSGSGFARGTSRVLAGGEILVAFGTGIDGRGSSPTKGITTHTIVVHDDLVAMVIIDTFLAGIGCRTKTTRQ